MKENELSSLDLSLNATPADAAVKHALLWLGICKQAHSFHALPCPPCLDNITL